MSQRHDAKKCNMNKLLLFTLLLAFSGQSLMAAEPNKKLPKALVIGDSICISGYANPLKEELAGKVEVMIGAAQSSTTTLKGLEDTLKHYLGDGKADVIHFNFGLWDMCIVSYNDKGGFYDDNAKGRRMVDPAETEKNLREFVRILKGRTDRLVWASITPIPDTPGRHQGDDFLYNKMAETVMKENGIPIDDLYSYMLPHVNEYRNPNDVHFNTAGSAFLARKVAGTILEALSGELKPQPFAIHPDKPSAIGERSSQVAAMPRAVRPEIHLDPRERGNYAYHEMDDKSLLVCSTTGWKWRITSYDHYVLRVQSVRAGDSFPPPDRTPVVHHPGQVADLVVEDSEGELRIRTWATDGIPLTFSKKGMLARWPWPKGTLEDSGGLAYDGTSASWKFRPQKDERFFSLEDGSDITGTEIKCQYAKTTPAGVPGFLSDRNYGMVLNTDQAVGLNLGRNGDLSFLSADQPVDLFVVVGKDREEVLRRAGSITDK